MWCRVSILWARAHVVLGAPDLAGDEMCDVPSVVLLDLATHQQHQVGQSLLTHRENK